MDVDTTHPDYAAAESGWQIVRDCLAGARQMRKNALSYIPTLKGQALDSYYAYVKRAVFFNACKRTLQALVGFIFSKNPEIETDAGGDIMAVFLKDATMTGKPLYDYAKETMGQVLSVGRRCTVIDWHTIERRPYISGYNTEDITNWRFSRIDDQWVLTLLELREWVPAAADEFDTSTVEQWRVYTLERTEGGQPYVWVRLFQREHASQANQSSPTKATQVSGFKVVEDFYPNRMGEPLAMINVVPHGAEENSFEIGSIPLEDIAEINVAHFRNSADYERALHVAGAPTPIAVGFDTADVSKLQLGTENAWVSENPQANAFFLAYDAAAATAFKDAMTSKKEEMAALGARMLERQGQGGGGAEAFQTVQIRQSGDHSALMSAAINGSTSLTEVMKWAAWWNDRKIKKPGDIPDDKLHYELNTEFIQTLMDAPMLTAVVSGYLQGAYSREVMFEKLKAGGVIPSERTLEEEKTALQNDPLHEPGPDAGQPGQQQQGQGDYHDPTVKD